MLNSEEPAPDDGTVHKIIADGPRGAVAVAAVATFVVVLMWLLFYLFVFVPRSG
jgi:hypothetical protein